MSEKKPYRKPVLTDLGPVSAGDLTELCARLRAISQSDDANDSDIERDTLAAAATIESLQRDLERTEAARLHLIAMLKTAEARAAANEKDAERYRYARHNSPGGIAVPVRSDVTIYYSGGDLDAAIDAALAQKVAE